MISLELLEAVTTLSREGQSPSWFPVESVLAGEVGGLASLAHGYILQVSISLDLKLIVIGGQGPPRRHLHKGT